MAQQRVLQLPKFAVVEVMIDLDGRDQLNSEKWEIRDQFWRKVLGRLNELYPENQSEVRTVNHVKRTWCALKQRVLARAKTANRETLPSDRKVLYLLQACDSIDEDATVNLERLAKIETASANDSNAPSTYSTISSGDVTLPKNIEPLLDAMIVCGGRAALPKKRASTVNGKQEYRRFWDKVHMVLQFNSQCTGRSVLSFQRAWYNIRMHYNNKEKRGDRDRSLQARKAYYLMRILSQEQAKLGIDSGMVYDTADTENENQSNGSRCEVIKQEPLDLTQLIMNGFNQQLDDDMVEDDASSSVYDAINSNENGDILSPFQNRGNEAFPDEIELRQKLLICQIEREKAQTELLKAQKRLIEAQLQGVFQSELPILENSKHNFLDDF